MDSENSEELITTEATITSLIVSHQARMLCILLNIFGDAMFGGHPKIRFKNCAIVKLSLLCENSIWKLSQELFYDGEIDEMKPDYIYFTNNPEVTGLQNMGGKYQEYPFRKQTIQNGVLDKLKISPNDIDPNIMYEFYLMRHGQATHNVYKGVAKMKSIVNVNTELTPVGIQQAQRTATVVGILDIPFNYLFVSDLVRTHQTLNSLGLPLSSIGAQVIMLPCSHEIDGQCPTCDGCSTPFVPGENATNDKSFQNGAVIVDTTFYTGFYSGKRRGSVSGFNSKRENCASNTFLGIAIKIIHEKMEAKIKQFESLPERPSFSIDDFEQNAGKRSKTKKRRYRKSVTRRGRKSKKQRMSKRRNKTKSKSKR